MEEWTEETEILAAEFKRTYASFRRTSQLWDSVAEVDMKPGYSAYAFEKAAMFSTVCCQNTCRRNRRHQERISGRKRPLLTL